MLINDTAAGGIDWYSRMVIMRTTKAYYSMSNKNGKPNARVYNRLATVELLQTVGSQHGINAFKGTSYCKTGRYP